MHRATASALMLLDAVRSDTACSVYRILSQAKGALSDFQTYILDARQKANQARGTCSELCESCCTLWLVGRIECFVNSRAVMRIEFSFSSANLAASAVKAKGQVFISAMRTSCRLFSFPFSFFRRIPVPCPVLHLLTGALVFKDVKICRLLIKSA
jgi:hypothetical protein